MIRALVIAVLAFTALAAAPPAEQLKVAIAEIFPDPVDYPKSPNAVIQSEKRTGLLYAWVIRKFDGAIVRKYEVPLGDVQPITIEVHERTNDPLAARARGKDPVFPFTLAVLNADHVLEASRAFSVRVTPQGHWHTGVVGPETKWWPADAYIAGGQLTEIRSAAEGKIVKTSAFNKPFLLPKDVKIAAAGKWLSPEEVEMWQPPAGQHVSLVYAYSSAEQMKVSQVIVGITAPPVFGASSDKPFLTGARFQIGTLDAQKPVKGEEVVIDVTTPRGRRSWRVTKATEILAGVATKQIAEVEKGTLLAITPEAAAPEPAARQIVLLQDRAGVP